MIGQAYNDSPEYGAYLFLACCHVPYLFLFAFRKCSALPSKYNPMKTIFYLSFQPLVIGKFSSNCITHPCNVYLFQLNFVERGVFPKMVLSPLQCLGAHSGITDHGGGAAPSGGGLGGGIDPVLPVCILVTCCCSGDPRSSCQCRHCFILQNFAVYAV